MSDSTLISSWVSYDQWSPLKNHGGTWCYCFLFLEFNLNHNLRKVGWNTNSVILKKSELDDFLLVINLDIAATGEQNSHQNTDSECLVIVCTVQIGTNSVMESCFWLRTRYVMTSSCFLMLLIWKISLFVYNCRIISVSCLFLVITHPISLFCTLSLILFVHYSILLF